METILFGVVGWNIAETTRMIEVAKAFRHAYDCHFCSYGGQFHKLVTENGFKLHALAPTETPEKIDLLWKIDRGEAFQQPWSTEELRQRVRSELDLIETLQPAVVFLGSVLTLPLSCRIAKVPLVSVIPLALSRPYIKARLPLSPFLPPFLNRLGCFFVEKFPLLVGNVRKITREYGLPSPRSLLDLWEGDLNFVTESREFSLLKTLPDHWHFCGPIFAHLDTPVPEGVQNLLQQREEPLVFFAMGSSANHEVLLKTLSAFEGLPVQVIAPITAHLKEGDPVPDNVLVTDWLPALQVTEQVDIAVTHGGQGTVQTTVTAGVPFVGVGMQPEQALNIFIFAQYGNALLLNRRKLNTAIIQQAIQTVLNDEEMRRKAQRARQIMLEADAPQVVFEIVDAMIRGERAFPPSHLGPMK